MRRRATPANEISTLITLSGGVDADADGRPSCAPWGAVVVVVQILEGEFYGVFLVVQRFGAGESGVSVDG